jgi:hypothetical protein
MIDKNVFAAELKNLSDWFNKPISEDALARLYLIFSSKLTTDEFKRSVIWAWENCNSFPAPAKMIDSVIGTLDDRALIDWVNILKDTSLLSVVGRKALQSIGGSSTVRMSEKPDFLKKDFIAAYKAFAVSAAPDDLRSRQIESAPISINKLQSQRMESA